MTTTSVRYGIMKIIVIDYFHIWERSSTSDCRAKHNYCVLFIILEMFVTVQLTRHEKRFLSLLSDLINIFCVDSMSTSTNSDRLFVELSHHLENVLLIDFHFLYWRISFVLFFSLSRNMFIDHQRRSIFVCFFLLVIFVLKDRVFYLLSIDFP